MDSCPSCAAEAPSLCTSGCRRRTWRIGQTIRRSRGCWTVLLGARAILLAWGALRESGCTLSWARERLGLLGTLSGCYRAPGTARDQLIFFLRGKGAAIRSQRLSRSIAAGTPERNPEINEQIQRVGRKSRAWPTSLNISGVRRHRRRQDGQRLLSPGGKVAVFTGILKHTKTMPVWRP